MCLRLRAARAASRCPAQADGLHEGWRLAGAAVSEHTLLECSETVIIASQSFKTVLQAGTMLRTQGRVCTHMLSDR
jgi:hypothetical protein